MKKLVINFEFKKQKKNIRFITGAIIIYLLFFMALFSGYKQYKSESEEIRKTQEITYQQWVTQGEKNPHSAAHYGLYAFKSAPLLLIFDKGIDDYLGRAVWLEAHNQNEVKISQVKDQGLTGRFGYLSVGYVWQFFIPLLIILLCFDSVNREKETGTIRMLFSTGINGRELLWGKILAHVKLIGLFMVLPMSVITVAVICFNAQSSYFSVLSQCLIIVLLYLLYFLIWIIFSVYFSSKFRTASALTILSGIWICMGFLIPRISGTIASMVYPTPNSFEFTQHVLAEREAGEDGRGSYEKFQEELKAKILLEYGVENLEDLPVSFAGYSLMESEKKDGVIYDKHFGELTEIFGKQNFLIGILNVLSPVQTQKSVSSAIARTDMHNHIYFASQAEDHRRLVQNILNDDQLNQGVGKERGYLASPELWKKIPDFHFQPNTIMNIIKQQWANLFLLAIWVLLGIRLINQSGKSLKYSV